MHVAYIFFSEAQHRLQEGSYMSIIYRAKDEVLVTSSNSCRHLQLPVDESVQNNFVAPFFRCSQLSAILRKERNSVWNSAATIFTLAIGYLDGVRSKQGYGYYHRKCFVRKLPSKCSVFGLPLLVGKSHLRETSVYTGAHARNEE